MEDLAMIAADCIVISCCCECLVLQIVIFFFLKLPYKMIRKTRAYAKKRLGRKRRSLSETCAAKNGPLDYRDQAEEFLKGIGVHGFGDDGEFCCMQQVEKVFEDLSQNGEFGFGSFWGREESAAAASSICAYCDQSRT